MQRNAQGTHLFCSSRFPAFLCNNWKNARSARQMFAPISRDRTFLNLKKKQARCDEWRKMRAWKSWKLLRRKRYCGRDQSESILNMTFIFSLFRVAIHVRSPVHDSGSLCVHLDSWHPQHWSIARHLCGPQRATIGNDYFVLAVCEHTPLPTGHWSGKVRALSKHNTNCSTIH